MMSNKILVIGIFVLLQLFNTLPAQTYEEWIQKSCDCIDKNDWMAAEEALKMQCVKNRAIRQISLCFVI